MRLVLKTALTFTASLLLLASCSSKHNDNNNNSKKISAPVSDPFNPKALLAYDPKNEDKAIDNVMMQLHKTRGFNGDVLVAKHGKIIYENAIGWADYLHRDS